GCADAEQVEGGGQDAAGGIGQGEAGAGQRRIIIQDLAVAVELAERRGQLVRVPGDVVRLAALGGGGDHVGKIEHHADQRKLGGVRQQVAGGGIIGGRTLLGGRAQDR